jgi:hypothetical protein
MAKSKARASVREAAPEPAALETGAAAAAAETAAVVIGRIAAGSRPERIVVDFDGNTAGPVVARATLALTGEALVRAVRERQGAVLVFEGGDPARPVLLGLLAAPSPSALLDSVIDETSRAAVASRPAAAPAGRQGQRKAEVEARLDGKRVVLEARDEIVLRCGDASITLRRDGKLMVRGAYVETRASGVNRIKGGAVKIN